MNIAIKFGYDGKKFFGSQIQKDKKTVEKEILDVLNKYDITNKIKIASRTDKGVSALGNVVLLETDWTIKDLFGVLNSSLNDIFFHSYSIVDENFNPRYAKTRGYRYYLQDKNFSVADMKKASELFIGKHDFRYFSKKDIRDTIREIFDISIEKNNEFIIIDIKGESFLWQMVRKIVWFLSEVGKESIDYSSDDFFEKPIVKGIVPPEPLILMDIEYDIEFKRYIPNELEKKLIKRYSQTSINFQIDKEFLSVLKKI